MNHLTMTINDEQIQVKEYQGTRVVTLADIDRVHKLSLIHISIKVL